MSTIAIDNFHRDRTDERLGRRVTVPTHRQSLYAAADAVMAGQVADTRGMSVDETFDLMMGLIEQNSADAHR